MTREALILLIGACPAVIVGTVWLIASMRDERAPASQTGPPPRHRTWPRAVLRGLLLGLAGLLGIFSRIGHLIAALVRGVGRGVAALGRGTVALLAASARGAGRGAAAAGHGAAALLRSAGRGTASLGRGTGRLFAALAGGAGSAARVAGRGARQSAAALARGGAAAIGLVAVAIVWLGRTIARGAPLLRRGAAAGGRGAVALASILAALCVAVGRGIGSGARVLGRGAAGAARGGGVAAKTGGQVTAGATRAAGGLARSAGRTTAKAKPLIPEAAGAIGSGASAGASGARRVGGGVGSTARRSVPPLRAAAGAVAAAAAALGSGIGRAGRTSAAAIGRAGHASAAGVSRAGRASAAGTARTAPRIGAGATAAGARIGVGARAAGHGIAIAAAAVARALVIAARAVAHGGLIAGAAIAAGAAVSAHAVSRGAAACAAAGMRALRAIGAGGAIAAAAIAAAAVALAARVRSAARSGASAAGSVRSPRIAPRRAEPSGAGSVAVSRPPQVPSAAVSSLRPTQPPTPRVEPPATRAEPPAAPHVEPPAPVEPPAQVEPPAPRAVTPPPPPADPPQRRAPMPTPPPPLRPSPVVATSSGGPSGPRWYRRLWHPWRIAGGLVTVVLVAVLSLGVLKYLEIVNALHGANSRVSTTLRRQLAPAGPILSTSQVTLLMGISGTQQRGSISAVGLATQPQRRRISLLYMPRTVRLPAGGSPTLEDVFAQGGPPLVTKTLSTSLGVPINHVVELNFDRLGSIVNALGGITLWNPKPVSIPPKPNGQLGGSFHAGKLQLSGRDAAIYIRSGTSPEDADRSQAERQSRVLGALVNRILALPATSAPAAASHILDNATSDLSANDLFGLIWFRFHAPVLTECRLSPTGLVAVAPGTPVGAFIAGGSNAACRLRHLTASPIALPATPQQLAVWLLIAPAAALLALIAVILTIVLVRRRGRRRPPAPIAWQPAPAPFIPPAAAVADTPPPPVANGRAAPAVSEPVPDVVSAAPGVPARTPVERPTLPRLDILQTLPRTALLDLAEARDVRTDELPHMSRDAILAALIEDALHRPRKAAATLEQNGHGKETEPAPGAELSEGEQPAGTPT